MMVSAVVAVATLMGLMAMGPYGDYTAARGRVEALSGTQQALVEEVVALESERARLEDPAALEEEARRQLGMTRPGEIPYIVVNPEVPLLHVEDGPVVGVGAVEGGGGDGGPLDRLLDLLAGWFG